MKNLTNEELRNIKGGWTLTSAIGIGALVTFIIGAIDGYVRPLACRQEDFMKQLNNLELQNIHGGLNLSAALITSLVRGVNSLLDLGRSLGTSIRRVQTGNICGF